MSGLKQQFQQEKQQFNPKHNSKKRRELRFFFAFW
jgi:hypothetical protein